jgi:hypothetical protein
VRCLLIEPFPESALNEQAGKMLLENYEDARLASISMLSAWTAGLEIVLLFSTCW